MNKGDKVMVKSFLKQPVVRCLWGEHNESAYICREEEYHRWKSGKRQPLCTLVSKDSIFKYDHDLFEKMICLDGIIEVQPPELDYLWQKAKHFFSE